MQLYYFLQALLVTGAVSSRNEHRQVIVTVTAPPTPVGSPSAPSPVPLSAPPVPWEQSSTVIPAPIPVPTSPSSGNLSLPPLPPLHPTTASVPSVSGPSALSAPTAVSPVPDPLSSESAGIGAKCGKGYTYCGYMLTGGGHNFAQGELDKSYCNGLPDLCAGGKYKTSVDQAVFVCMTDQPSSIQLLCACSGTCLNNATSNYIAHCDKPCVNI